MTSEQDGRAAAVVGAGPAGLMAAEGLAAAGLRVTVYDRMASPARKLLLAGRGGLNLTHSEEPATFLTRYAPLAPQIARAVEAFPPAALRAWAQELGQETFVGSSGRVFPVAMKASPLLRAWLRRLETSGVRFALRHRWTGWDEAGRLCFEAAEQQVTVAADVTVLALGGASWPRLGADGGWVPLLSEAGVGIVPLAPANCGFTCTWSEHLRTRFAGEPLKRIALTWGADTVRGEALVTADGIEGGAVYALSRQIREAIRRDGAATVTVDLRPDLPAGALAVRLAKPRGKQSLATFLRKQAQLSPVAVSLLHESRTATLAGLSPPELAALIKALPLRLASPAGLDRAISTAGGIAWDAVDDRFMLRARPGVFVAGEMLDWEAPTGGYLLQACFATAAAAAAGAVAWVGSTGEGRAKTPDALP